MTPTFFTLSLSIMNLASFGPWMPSSGTTRKKAGVASFCGPFVSEVLVADGETWAMPAWKYVWLEAATAPDVDGPRMAITLLSATNFCARLCAGAGPCSTGVSPVMSRIFRPIFGGRVFTAYFAQVSCSWPRNAAPPVSGVTNAILSVLLQLSAAVRPAFTGAADADAAITQASAAATVAATNAVLLFMCPPWMISIPLDVESQLFVGFASSYEREAGSPDGWKTPRIRITPAPSFSMQCTCSGGRWKQDPGRSGVCSSPMWATPSPSMM